MGGFFLYRLLFPIKRDSSSASTPLIKSNCPPPRMLVFNYWQVDTRSPEDIRHSTPMGQKAKGLLLYHSYKLLQPLVLLN